MCLCLWGVSGFLLVSAAVGVREVLGLRTRFCIVPGSRDVSVSLGCQWVSLGVREDSGLLGLYCTNIL